MAQLEPSGLRPRVCTFPPSETMPLVTPALRMALIAFSAAQPLATEAKLIAT